MKTKYRKFMWKIALFMINRWLKKLSNTRPITEIRIGTPDWKTKKVIVYCTEMSRNLVTLFPGKILGFIFTGTIVDKI